MTRPRQPTDDEAAEAERIRRAAGEMPADPERECRAGHRSRCGLPDCPRHGDR